MAQSGMVRPISLRVRSSEILSKARAAIARGREDERLRRRTRLAGVKAWLAAQRAFNLEEKTVSFMSETAQKRWRERRKLVQEELKRIRGTGPVMSVVFKTTVNRPSALVIDREAMAAVPIDQQALLNALGDAMGILAAEQRKEREQQVSELRERIAAIEGKVEVLMSLMQGKGQVIDLPPLPRSVEASPEKTIRKLRMSR